MLGIGQWGGASASFSTPRSSSGVGGQQFSIQLSNVDSIVFPRIYCSIRGVGIDINFPTHFPVYSAKVLNDILKGINIVILKSNLQFQYPGISQLFVCNKIPPQTSSLLQTNLRSKLSVTMGNVGLVSLLPPPPQLLCSVNIVVIW